MGNKVFRIGEIAICFDLDHRESVAVTNFRGKVSLVFCMASGVGIKGNEPDMRVKPSFSYEKTKLEGKGAIGFDVSGWNEIGHV